MVNGVAVHPRFRPTGAMWLTALRTLEKLADVGEEFDVVFCLENLNTVVDHPGIPLARLADTTALVAAVDSPRVRLMLDLYHVQLTTGRLIQHLETALPWASEIQVADVPGRLEPGTGEVNYAAVARYLKLVGFDQMIGLEGYASASSEAALGSFVATFG